MINWGWSDIYCLKYDIKFNKFAYIKIMENATLISWKY